MELVRPYVPVGELGELTMEYLVGGLGNKPIQRNLLTADTATVLY